MTTITDLENGELIDNTALAFSDDRIKDFAQLRAEILRRLAASQPGGNNPQICPKCGRKADGYISATPTRKGGHYILLCDYSPSHPSGSSAPSPQPPTQGDTVQHESLKQSDASKSFVDAWAGSVAPSGSAGPEPSLSHEDICRLGRVFIEHSNWGRDSQDSRIHEWLKIETARKAIAPDPPAETSAEAKGPHVAGTVGEQVLQADSPRWNELARRIKARLWMAEKNNSTNVQGYKNILAEMVSIEAELPAEPAVVSASTECEFCRQPELYKPVTWYPNDSKYPSLAPVHESIRNPRRFRICTAAQPVAADLSKEVMPTGTEQARRSICTNDANADNRASVAAASLKTSGLANPPKVEEAARKLAKLIVFKPPLSNKVLNKHYENNVENLSQQFAAILRPYFQGSQTPTDRQKLAKSLEYAAHCFYGEQYGDAPGNLEMVEFAAKFAACQLTGYKTEEEERDEAPVTPVSGNGPEPPEMPSHEDIKKVLGSGWKGFKLNDEEDLDFVIGQIRLAIMKCDALAGSKRRAAGAASHNGQGWDEMNKAGWLLYRSLLSMRCCSELKEEPDADECKSMGVAMKAWEAATGEKFQEKFALPAPPSEANVPTPRNAFKNFHRSLCARFGYLHDEKDWERDQASLEEHIAAKIAELRGTIKLVLGRIRNTPWEMVTEADVDGYIAEFERISTANVPTEEK